MRIVDGNIFEAMRLVLPEHREVMKREAVAARRRKMPVVSEDAWSEMEYVLQEALEYQLPVAVSLFHPLEDRVLIGVPSTRNGGLFLQTAEGVDRIEMSKVLNIIACE
ncbi:YolD-like family protein [Tumebacillus lipolyticus]|uniref:YolD-like family protein n=1 Tax=Tumebacillus lipolyticus TaxID=1280370 RepID=A0ABW5A0X1_9BACL